MMNSSMHFLLGKTLSLLTAVIFLSGNTSYGFTTNAMAVVTDPPTRNLVQIPSNQDAQVSRKNYYGKDFQGAIKLNQQLNQQRLIKTHSNPVFFNPFAINEFAVVAPEAPVPPAEEALNSPFRTFLKNILQKWHQVQSNDFDVITDYCEGRSCYKHTSIGYDGARKFLLGKYYLVKDGNNYAVKDVYCSKEYSSDEFRNQKPGPGLIPDNTVVNVEHTWPQSRFSSRYPTDIQKADVHHLYPTDTTLNSIRGNNPFGDVSHNQQNLKCSVSRFGLPSYGHYQVFEPPDEHKGHVARALFYFSVKYDKVIDPDQERVLKQWHQDYPVDADEFQRNDVIYRMQGSRNPFVDYPNLVEQISNF